MPRIKRANSRVVAPTFAVTDLGGGEAEIVLYGEVMQDEPRDFWTGEPTGENAITSERFNRELDSIRNAKHVTVRLNSCGGDVFTALGIYSALTNLGAAVTVRIEGIAASSASIISCAGDEIIAGPGSIFMIHEACVGLMGYYQISDLDAMRKDLEATNSSIQNIYAKCTKKPKDELAAMMADETWLVGQEIVDAGFATSMDSDEPAEDVEDEGDGEVKVAGVLHDFRSFRNVPHDLAARVAASSRMASASMGGAAAHMAIPARAERHKAEPPEAAEEKGVEHMTLDELRAQAPELVAAIEAEAVQAERDRIAQIDEIAGDVPADLVASAKYNEPCTAQELAYRAMVARKADHEAKAESEGAHKAAFAAAVMADAAESGADGVGADPNSGSEAPDERAEAQAEVAKMAEVFASIQSKKGVR